ncbi:MAG: hypothetical protein OR995_06525 [Candidatus Nanopelagicales bacterium]|nr:hypothetical protein [Candidatus Nanopelagicales bacterium]
MANTPQNPNKPATPSESTQVEVELTDADLEGVSGGSNAGADKGAC